MDGRIFIGVPHGGQPKKSQKVDDQSTITKYDHWRDMVSEGPSMRDSWKKIIYKGYDSKDDLWGTLTEG